METARGKYLAFWDADDYFEKNALALLYAKCEKERADMCLCAAYSVDEKSGRRAVDETFLKRRFLPNKSVFSIETDPEYIFNMASNTPWQRLLRADFVRQHGLRFQNLRHANDTYFSLMATYFAKRITYTENRSSITEQTTAKALRAGRPPRRCARMRRMRQRMRRLKNTAFPKRRAEVWIPNCFPAFCGS